MSLMTKISITVENHRGIALIVNKRSLDSTHSNVISVTKGNYLWWAIQVIYLSFLLLGLQDILNCSDS